MAAGDFKNFIAKLPGGTQIEQAEQSYQDAPAQDAPAEEWEVGKVYDGIDGTKLKYLGGNPDDEKSWEDVTPPPAK